MAIKRRSENYAIALPTVREPAEYTHAHQRRSDITVSTKCSVSIRPALVYGGLA